MSTLTESVERIGNAIEEIRRAFVELITETEIANTTIKQLRRDISEGLNREAELRNLLRGRGLASYDPEQEAKK